MSDKIHRMDKPTDEQRNEILIEILRTLKSHAQSLEELRLDVAGLKALLDGQTSDIYNVERERQHHARAFAADRELHSLDEAIALLLRT